MRPLGTMQEMARNSSLSDEELVQRTRDGEPGWFEVLMRRYNSRVYRAVRSVLRDEAEVEDAMQQAYVAAYTHLSQFAGEARFSTWLLRIAMNEALGRVRRHIRFHDLESLVTEDLTMLPPQDPERRAASRELIGLLEAGVDALPDLYRTVFVMREVEGLDTAETALALGLKEEAVKTRLHRAKTLLREHLYERAGESVENVFTFHASRCDRMVNSVMAQIGVTARIST